MTLLITGGTGFLGSYFTRYALTQGQQAHVHVLDRYADRSRVADCLDRISIVEGDIADAELVERVIRDNGIDCIAHFAFILGSPTTGQMQNYVKVQLLGTANVLEAARNAGVRRVLFASSVAAYGRQSAELLHEGLLPNPTDPYGAAKLWCESTMQHYREALGLETVTVRYGSTYGLGRAQRGSYASGLLKLPKSTHYLARVEDAARGKAVTMPRSDALADFTYASDAAKAGWLALTADDLPHHLYNVASRRHPIGDFTQAMRRVLPQADIAQSPEELPGNAHPPMDGAQLIEDFGFTPDFSLEKGISDYVERIRIMDEFQEKPV